MHHMNVNGTPLENQTILPTPTTRQQRRKAISSKSRGFCGRLSDCLVMGPAASHRVLQEQRPIEFDKIYNQVEEIDIELQKQRELTDMYKIKLQKTQTFLKYCLEVAQENGFMDLILNKDRDQDFSISHSATRSTISPPSPSSTELNPYLAALIHRAKAHGWYIDPQEIEMQHLAAQGSTADVYRGKWRGLDVAVKCIYADSFRNNENGVTFFTQEVETLSRQRHPYVLQLMGACLDPPDNCWIVTEFLNTNLKDWLHGPGKRQKERTVPTPPFKDRIAKALEIAQAMQYLHESRPKILHRDLKPSNIFLDDALHVRVADFGHARYLSDGEKALTGETGTFIYMAPEVIKCGPYDEKCDVYSFGIILNELIAGEYPYIETDYGPAKIALEVAENGLRPSIGHPTEQGQELTQLVKQCWDQEPAIRPGFSEITSTLRIIMKILKDIS